MDKNFSVDDSAKHYEQSRQDAVKSWAQRRQEQIDLAEKNKGLSLYQQMIHAPKNIWSELTTDLAEKKDTNHQIPDEYRINVYEAMLKAASQGMKPARETEKQWKMLKDMGHY